MNNYRFLVEPICDSEIVQSLNDATLKGQIVYSKLREGNLSLPRVKKGTPLIRRNDSESEGIAPSENDQFDFDKTYRLKEIGSNINNMLGGKDYFADVDGIFFINDNVPCLLEINFDCTYRLNVSDDKMEVYIDLFPPAPEGKKFLVKQLFEEIKEFGLKTEINGTALESAIKSLDGNEFPVYGTKIASGIYPLDGVDGNIEYFVNTKVDFSPKVNEDGRIDFYNLNIINSVEADQDLVLFHPHIEGKDGRNVFGDIIPARKARVIKFPQGRNTYPHKDNPNLIKAKVDGIIVEKDGIISVSEIFKIDGNVDYSTGNINNKGSVSVLGDVKSGFTMEVNDVVDVRGIVEDCIIKAGSDVRVKSGFSGKGHGVIFSQGNVDVRYVRNQRIHSRKSINVSNEVFDSELFAAHRIQVAGGKNMSILGGHTIAGSTVEVNCLGNEYGVKTIVEAGFDYSVYDRIDKNKEEIDQLDKTLGNVEEGTTKLVAKFMLPVEMKKTLLLLIKQKVLLMEKQAEYADFEQRKVKIDLAIEKILKSSKIDNNVFSTFLTLVEQRIVMRSKIKNLENEIKGMEKTIHTPTKAKIKVNRTIYPGTTLMINKIKFVVTQPMLNKVFYIDKDGKEINFA